MSKDKGKELRERSIEELNTMLRDLREEQFKLGFRHRTQQLENTAKLGDTRRQIARVTTILRERADKAGA